MSSFIQSVPGTTKLHRPCDPADPCSGQKSWCNPMELDRHGLFIPACGSATLQGSLVHHEYSSCSFGILHYPLSANTELYYYWRPPDGAQPCGMTLLFQFLAGNIIPVLALWVLSSCRLFSVAKLQVHLQSEKLWRYHPSCGLTFCLNIIYVVQDKSSCSFLFGQQLEPWHPWEIVLLVTVYHHPPPATPPDKSTYISADKRVRIQWSILIVDCSCNYSWLMHSATLFKFKVRKVLVLHIGARGTSADVFSIGYYLILHNQKVQIELSIMVAFSQAPNLQNMQLGAQKGQCSSRIILMSECAINYGPLFESWFQPLPTGIFLLVPIVQRVASDDCHRIMMLGKYSSCKESLFESFQWYIAWSQLSSCAGSDFDGSGTLSQEVIMGSRHLGSLYYFRFFTQAEAKGRSVATPDYCHGLDHGYFFDKVCANQDNYLDVFHDQVHIGNDYYLGVFLEQVDTVYYINLVKVCLADDAHRDLGEVMKHQVPWDPGGSKRHRLEDKPKFKEGGMLATFSNITVGPDHGLALQGLGFSDATKGSSYLYERIGYRQQGLGTDGFGLL